MGQLQGYLPFTWIHVYPQVSNLPRILFDRSRKHFLGMKFERTLPPTLAYKIKRQLLAAYLSVPAGVQMKTFRSEFSLKRFFPMYLMRRNSIHKISIQVAAPLEFLECALPPVEFPPKSSVESIHPVFRPLLSMWLYSCAFSPNRVDYS